MKFTYRKTLSNTPYGIEEFTVEDEIPCLQDIPQIVRAIREQVRSGLKPEPEKAVEGPLDVLNCRRWGKSS